MEYTNDQISILKEYLKLVKKLRRHATVSELKEAGTTPARVDYHFGSHTKLKAQAKKYQPDAFKGIIDEELFNPKTFAELEDKAKAYKRFVITTAVTGCKVHKGFYESLKRYCKKNKAMLLILPVTDPASTAGWTLDPLLDSEHKVFHNLQLNKNLYIASIKMSAKHIDPTTGLDRIGQRNGSMIYASPKQMMKVVPTSNEKLPHVLMTTGSITKPNYHTDRYMSERTAYIADHDHVMGAVVVEIKDSRHFFFRQLQAETSGSFVDLGSYYQPDEIGTMMPIAFVLGDYHAGETDPTAEKIWLEVCNLLPPDYVVFHDVFNGTSVSHHESQRHILRYLRSLNKELTIEDEGKAIAKVFETYKDKCNKKMVVVKSNHDLWLNGYLEEGLYIKDPLNTRIAHMLALAMMDGQDPLKALVDQVGCSAMEKVLFLMEDQDFKVAGIELGAHGHVGANGASGSLQQMEKAYGVSVSGHTHTPGIKRQAWMVGTSSYLRLAYNKGASSWLHSSCLVYPNGARQLINIINGEWRLKD